MGELGTGLAVAVAGCAAALAVPPARLAGVQDEPAVAGSDEPVLGRPERRLRNHRRGACPIAAPSRKRRAGQAVTRKGAEMAPTRPGADNAL
jgi:hypothetical protein